MKMMEEKGKTDQLRESKELHGGSERDVDVGQRESTDE